MSDIPFQFSQKNATAMTIEIVPVEEEEEDLDTLAAVGQVHAEMQRDAGYLEGYSIESLPTNERGIDMLQLIPLIGVTLSTHEDLLISFFKMISAALELLTKRGQVEEIEIIADGKTLILRNISKKTAKELIEAFEAQHPGMTAMLSPATSLKVKAKVSKKRRSKR